jgi:hypothetical protein
MALDSSRLASGPGWCVDDILCTAGPRDRPFEEQHRAVCIAAVTAGTFPYRSAQGSAVLAPGALLLGNDRQSFECGHEHAVGDRCLSFHFAPELVEAIAAAVPGVRRATFAVARLPPLPALAAPLAAAEAARDDGDGAELEELALRLAGAVSAALAGAGSAAPRAPSRRDERRGDLRPGAATPGRELGMAGRARRRLGITAVSSGQRGRGYWRHRQARPRSPGGLVSLRERWRTPPSRPLNGCTRTRCATCNGGG